MYSHNLDTTPEPSTAAKPLIWKVARSIVTHVSYFSFSSDVYMHCRGTSNTLTVSWNLTLAEETKGFF